MKLWIVGACILYLSLPVALGLKCYTCSSINSWDECKATSKSCPAGADRCGKLYFKAGGVETFMKTCYVKAACNQDDNPTCKGAVGIV
ncbi:hypothetical protein OS493_005341 [Desmophyllum pertusum]|uniref:UPAR/Ly6 domain-containing protein n=1 Tax=Desmophyllum pertusum TaxID=174260 RepID=A0A9W9YV36_9CNID|nr:hypothetical protein OS493_005341 [Desmophyllum pertusum]